MSPAINSNITVNVCLYMTKYWNGSSAIILILPEQFGVNDNIYLVHFQNSSHILGNAKKSITDIGLRIILPKASENTRSHVSIPMTPFFYIV